MCRKGRCRWGGGGRGRLLGGKGLERLGKREYYIIRRYVEKRERVREAALKRGCHRTLNVTAVHGMGIQHAVQLQHLTVIGGFS